MAYQERLFEILAERRVPNSKISLDIRLIATSTKDLGQMVDDGLFDRELYEYLSKAYIYMEPLRRRMEDISLLVEYFLKIECKKQGLLLKSFSPKMMEKIKDYDWPGNVKEMRVMVERAVLYNPKAHVISEVDLETSASPLVDKSMKQRMFGDLPFVGDFHISLKDRLAIVEREMIINEIKRCNGNKSKAAKEMGISREALRKKLLISREVLDVLEDAHPEQKKKAA
jgi:Nif-specific regulatory protein